MDRAPRSTRKPGYRLTRRRRRPRGRECWLQRYLQHRLRWWRGDQERSADRIWRERRWQRLREKGMFRRRLIDGDRNCLRQEAVLRKCHRLAFDSQCQRARCLAGLALRGAHSGAAWDRLELHGLRRRRRRRLMHSQAEHQRRASREGVTHRDRDRDED